LTENAEARVDLADMVVRASEREGLLAFQQRRKASSRERLLAAAASTFIAKGYFGVSVEDIASTASVSRMTFYRHFSGKAEIAAALFDQTSHQHMPQLLAIGRRDFSNPEIVTAWLAEIFATNRERRQFLKVYNEANVAAAGFSEQGHAFIRELISELGERIPAFALDPDAEADRPRWLEAWLLLYEILDQSNHAARESGVATDPLIIGILAKRVVAFIADRPRASEIPKRNFDQKLT